jgi:hypothetical protein
MGQETNGDLGGAGPGGLASAAMAADDLVTGALLDLDWFNRTGCLFWLAQPGKTGVWLDLDGVFIQGHNGRWLDREIAGMGVTIYAKMVVVQYERLLALIVVARRHAAKVRRWLAKKKILVQ